MEICQIRAHHGLCTCFFTGRGYSDSFTAHMEQIIELLKQNPVIRLSDRADEICSCCPNQTDGSCKDAALVRGYDSQVLSLCGLKAGEELSWERFRSLVRSRILETGEREHICGDCQWSELCTAVEKGRQKQLRIRQYQPTN